MSDLTCPLCKKNLSEAARILGATRSELRKFHADVHQRELMDGVWNRAARIEEMNAFNVIDDWAKEER